MEWSKEFYAWKAGHDCPSCAEGRPDATRFGVRYFAGDRCDAYLVRADIQRGLTVAVFRGRHVVEPTQLTDGEAASYGQEVLHVARAIEVAFAPIKLNYDLLGNSMPHLHTHIVPRYADDPRPGWPFPFPDADPPPMPDDRLNGDLAELRRALNSAARSNPDEASAAPPIRDSTHC